MSTIKERYESVRSRMASAAERSGHDPDKLHLVAVTKYASMEQVRELIELGHRDFGESRQQHFTQLAAQVDEYIDRRRELGEPNLEGPIRWHFIGHLQRNKARRVIPLARLIHSLDSLRLAEEMQPMAAKRDQVVEVLIQVNVSGERRKYGVAPPAVTHLLDQMDTMINIEPRGIMYMAPLCEDQEESRSLFNRCRELFDDVCKSGAGGERFNILSMGMSNDFEVAIECGANIVRVGTAIFGDAAESDSTADEKAAC